MHACRRNCAPHLTHRTCAPHLCTAPHPSHLTHLSHLTHRSDMPTSYAIRHLTRFTYASPVSESVMELRMRPATDGAQRCLQFDLQFQPRARVFAYRDSLGNWVHHFDLPRRHGQLAITARAHVQIDEPRRCRAAAGQRLGRRRSLGGRRRVLGFPPAEPLRRMDRRAVAFASELLGPVAARSRSVDAWFAQAMTGNSRRVRIRAEQHARGLADRRRACSPPGGVPGLHPHHAGDAAAACSCRVAM